MFKKILIANRGEIAVRVIRTCRDMGIATVALVSQNDRNALHVRLADECYPITSEKRFGDGDEVLAIAKACGADAIHPGYGFLAEQPEFAEACAAAGIAFIGPPAEVIRTLRMKVPCLEKVEAAGFSTPPHSETHIDAAEPDLLIAQAADLGYPLVIKSCRGGRGRGSRIVDRPERLIESVAKSQRESLGVFASDHVYLERVIAPSHHVEVQILADGLGNVVHLGERDGSLQRNNQKMIVESPAPYLSPAQREEITQAAITIARLFNYSSVGTVEFLVDGEGGFHFTEIKARIQVEHPVNEMRSGVDLVAQQIRIAAGEPLGFTQADIHLRGWAMQCRVNAEDPWNNYLPSPGVLERFRIPGGHGVRVDSSGYVGYPMPVRYDSLVAKVVAWGEDRAMAHRRLRRALQDFKIVGVQTNIPLHLHILADERYAQGHYNTNFMHRATFRDTGELGDRGPDLAAAVAVAFVIRNQTGRPVISERTQSGWHRSSRRLPS